MFHWNTKQLFLYLEAEYTNDQAVSFAIWILSFFYVGSRALVQSTKDLADIGYFQVKNEVVIWDRIVRRKEDAVVNVVGKNKYMFRELSASFKWVERFKVWG